MGFILCPFGLGSVARERRTKGYLSGREAICGSKLKGLKPSMGRVFLGEVDGVPVQEGWPYTAVVAGILSGKTAVLDSLHLKIPVFVAGGIHANPEEWGKFYTAIL